MRGEDYSPFCNAAKYDGSPPHARGRLDIRATVDNWKGITPACAGKTTRRTVRFDKPQDHPRMRGEDGCVSVASASPSGSPPHARGRPRHVRRLRNLQRITPACAGKTLPSRSRRQRRPDHPRMRGEDRTETASRTASRGSPPHARGRPSTSTSQTLSSRITPACAGKTSTSFTTLLESADHPRMRGEDLSLRRLGAPVPGSPPHARGRHAHLPCLIKEVGITPACAGKTGTLSRGTIHAPGSPPHARGRRRSSHVESR